MAHAKTLRANLQVEALETREMLSTLPLNLTSSLLRQETFQSTLVGDLPSGWSQWTNNGPVAVSTDKALSGRAGLEVNGITKETARAWSNQRLTADVQASVAVF